MAAGDALPLPRKNVAFRWTFEIRDTLGALVTGAAGLDSEVSKDGGAFADCTNEATEIGNGIYYLDLTSTEMNADCTAVVVKTSTTNAIPPAIVLYPAEDADIKTNLVQCNGNAVAAGAIPNVAAGATGGLPVAQLVTTIATLASQSSFTLTDGPPDDDALNHMALLIRDASTAGQFTVGVVVDYVGSTKAVTFGTGSVYGTDFTIAVGDSVMMMGPYPLVPTTAARALDVNTSGEAGLDWANVGGLATSNNLSGTTVNAVNNTGTLAGASSVFIAANGLTAAGLAADAGTEIAAAVRAAIATELGYLTGDAFARLGAPAGASVSVDIAAVKSDTGTTGVLLADSEDVYPADIQFTRDDENSKDEYTVLWFRNGTPVTSGITVPLIQVVKRADGTDLIASTAMTQIGSTGAYKYDESTAANRIDDGEAVLVTCTATINGSARTWRKTITRDQTN